MENMHFPAFYAPITEDEQRTVFGGGELTDALGDFFDNFQLFDFFLGNKFIAVSFTFMPLLLFNVAKAAYGLVKNFNTNVATLRNDTIIRLGQLSSASQTTE